MVEAVGTARVAVIDDHPLFRHGLAVALQREPGVEIIGDAGDAVRALELARTTPIDVAILDILMPTTSGISLAYELHELQPRCRVLGLSVVDEPCLIAEMLRAHACGYALKTQPIAEIVEAIRHVLGGRRYLPPSISADAVEAALAGPRSEPLERLTRREREIFELVIRGHSSDEVAAKLFISRRTVETHRQRVAKKLSTHSVVQLQRLAALHGAGLGR